MTGRTLVAGVGNIFLGDDAFGVEVTRVLARTADDLPAGVEVADFGIRGVHLAYQLMEGYDRLVLVDAMPRGEQPGTVYVVEPDLAGPGVDPGAAGRDTAGQVAVPDPHSMDPSSVLAMLAAVNGGMVPVRQVVVVGCEPMSIEDGIGLSPAVAAAVDRGVAAVLELLRQEPVEAGGGDR